MPKSRKKLSSNYEGFLKVNTRSYRGEWIALVGKRVVAHGKRADATYQKAVQKHPRSTVSLAKVPDAETLVLFLL